MENREEDVLLSSHIREDGVDPLEERSTGHVRGSGSDLGGTVAWDGDWARKG
jgi:hypothetical protein